MPRLSKEKIKKIEEQILFFLYSIYPKMVFTVDIAREIARDEEFIKSLLINLEKQNLVVKVNRNKEGILYERRLRWKMSNKAYDIYSKIQ